MKQDELKNVIKNLRGKKTLRELEEISGVSNSYICQIEMGLVKSITLDTLGKLAHAFDISPENLLKKIKLNLN